MKRFFELAIIVLCLIVISVDIFVIYRTSKEPKTIHIYLDLATTPSLLQMIDLLQQDKEDLKFFAWRRFPNRSQYIDLKSINAVEITLPTNMPNTGNSQTEFRNAQDYKAISQEIAKIYEQHPNANYIIHMNRFNFVIIGVQIFRVVPLKQIKRVHIYEDGHGEIAKAKFDIIMNFINKTDIEQFKNYLQHYAPHTLNWSDSFLFKQLVPTTYHIGMFEKIQSNPKAKAFLNYLSNAEIVPVSFDVLKNDLSETTKQQLCQLLGINTQILKEMKQPKTILYTLGVPFNSKIMNNQINVIQALKNGKISPEIDSSWHIYYKEHPWLIKNKYLKHKISSLHKDVKALPKQIPLEILIIMDALPEKIIGYSSSLFYSLPPEKILAYIQRDNDPYLDALLKNKTLTREQIFELKDFSNEK